jgi:hypothetical protein
MRSAGRGPRACDPWAIQGAGYAGKRANQPARYLQRKTAPAVLSNRLSARLSVALERFFTA